MKHYFTSAILLLTICCVGQTTTTTSSSDSLYFKDGKAMGGKPLLVSACVEGINEKQENKDFKLNAEGACSCMLDVIAAQYTYKAFNAAFEKQGAKMFKELMKEGSPAYKQVINCVVTNMVTPDKKATAEKQTEKVEYSKETEKAFIDGCVREASKTKEFKQMKVDVKGYCSCTWDKIKEKGISLSELTGLSDPESPLFKEIIIPCLTDAIKSK
jgi:hypothetical protein